MSERRHEHEGGREKVAMREIVEGGGRDACGAAQSADPPVPPGVSDPLVPVDDDERQTASHEVVADGQTRPGLNR